MSGAHAVVGGDPSATATAGSGCGEGSTQAGEEPGSILREVGSASSPGSEEIELSRKKSAKEWVAVTTAAAAAPAPALPEAPLVEEEPFGAGSAGEIGAAGVVGATGVWVGADSDTELVEAEPEVTEELTPASASRRVAE